MTRIQLIAAVLTVPVVVWLMGGFVVMEFDPRLWSEVGRFNMVWLCTCGWAVLVVVALGARHDRSRPR